MIDYFIIHIAHNMCYYSTKPLWFVGYP